MRLLEREGSRGCSGAAGERGNFFTVTFAWAANELEIALLCVSGA